MTLEEECSMMLTKQKRKESTTTVRGGKLH